MGFEFYCICLRKYYSLHWESFPKKRPSKVAIKVEKKSNRNSKSIFKHENILEYFLIIASKYDVMFFLKKNCKPHVNIYTFVFAFMWDD